jgi:hypothetical protein
MIEDSNPTSRPTTDQLPQNGPDLRSDQSVEMNFTLGPFSSAVERVDRLVKGMLFDFEFPEPLRANIKSACYVRKNQYDHEHFQSNTRHFGFSVPYFHLPR